MIDAGRVLWVIIYGALGRVIAGAVHAVLSNKAGDWSRQRDGRLIIGCQSVTVANP